MKYEIKIVINIFNIYFPSFLIFSPFKFLLYRPLIVCDVSAVRVFIMKFPAGRHRAEITKMSSFSGEI